MTAVDLLVAQQYDRGRRGLAGEVMVGVDGGIVEGRGGIVGTVQPVRQVGDALCGGGDVILLESAVVHRGDDGGVTDPTVRGHLQVKAGLHRVDASTDGTPVGDHGAGEAPPGAQDVGEQFPAVADGYPVDGVVGAHDGGGGGVLHDAAEAAQVELVERSLVDIGARPHPVGLLVVQREVLE